MISGVGVDIVQNDRFNDMKEGLLKKIFTSYELEEAFSRASASEYLASRFAVKEAVVKALGTGFGKLGAADIEIRENESGKPFVILPDGYDVTIHISLSHEKDYSVAFAVAEYV